MTRPPAGLSLATRALAVAAASAGLSACSGEEGRVLESGETKILVGAEDDAEKDRAGIGMAGTVDVVGDCLGMDGTTVIWPYGTEVVDDSPLIIKVPGLGEVAVGDSIEGGADTYADYLPAGIDELPSGCPEGGLFAFYPNG